ncbi:hypothetical protein GCM10010460_16320 [Microbacterium terrae]|uniref:YdhG-like domain-containing protein n=1 Tax=Microbacterium terrae TaxID=69369 RepID=A0A0M2HGL0_9MICO|nr:DUF1801 domain-containing protein [Microbacterium terrae]KJL43897.1 hypothetical protein RS81_00690 [Microbacterium terrae]GLJ98095.1 hypothetical protein GCM10017594_12920 [Microbacterium terrae]
MVAPESIDAYIAACADPEVAKRLQRIRETIAAEVPDPEEKIRYGMPAIMLGGRYALHFAAWKKHIGLYPVPTLPAVLEPEVAPFRREKDSVVFPHREPIPYELIGRIAAGVVAQRRAAGN